MNGDDFSAFSIGLYRQPGVEDCCLRLQDECGLDVNVVLFCYWFGARHGLIEEALWQRIDSISCLWQAGLVRPLREARRWLKKTALEASEDREKLRQRIQEEEIAAELLQQKVMQQACAGATREEGGQPAESARRNVEALLRRHGLARNDEMAPEMMKCFAVISRAAFG